MSRLVVASFLLFVTALANAAEVKVAVAANFTAAMKEIAAAFAAATDHTALVSYGSTGKLYAQIQNGAPFDLFLAADQKRPRLLHEQGVADAPFTYAIGKLVLWSSDPALVDRDGTVLESGGFERLAIANPKTAPYGAGAMQVMTALGVLNRLEAKLVRGDNIAQTYQFVSTGNAQLGFVALSQVALAEGGSRWIPPQSLYDPIRQDAVLLANGRDNAAAQAFLEFLRGPVARDITLKYGYAVE